MSTAIRQAVAAAVIARHDSGKDGGDSKLDAVLEKLDAVLKRQDADRERLDAVCSKMDSIEEERKADKARKDAAEKEEKERADAAKKDADEKEAKEKEERERADAARRDAEEKERQDAAARAGAGVNEELVKRLAAIEQRLPAEVSETDRPRFVEAQSKAERIAQAFGDSAGAPRWLNGETLDQYRRRLAGAYKKHSPVWKDVDLSQINDSAAIGVAETQIYADAWNAAMNPTDLTEGQLREIKTIDAAGRTISSFVGSETAAWAPFGNVCRRGRIVRTPQQH